MPNGDMYDFPYRQYSAPQGRWVSPDPAGLGAMDLTNPQSCNAYGYVGGSPLNRVDPLGLEDGDGSFSFSLDFSSSFSSGNNSWLAGLVNVAVAFVNSIIQSNGSGSRWGVQSSHGNGSQQSNPPVDFSMAKFMQAGSGGGKAASPCNDRRAVSFVHAHQADAAAIAQTLGVPTENVLGLSARESGWGTGRFAQYNAFFDMEKTVSKKVPLGQKPSTLLPGSNGWEAALRSPRTFVATYANYLDSASSFATVYGGAVRGKTKPGDFLKALLNAGFNGDSAFTNPGAINMTKARMGCP